MTSKRPSMPPRSLSHTSQREKRTTVKSWTQVGLNHEADTYAWHLENAYHDGIINKKITDKFFICLHCVNIDACTIMGHSLSSRSNNTALILLYCMANNR